MKNRKPKLASGDRITVDTAGIGSPEFGSHSGIIQTAAPTEALPKRALRSMVTFAILGLTMLFLTYVVLATTVFVALRADGNTVGVLRNTFPVGAAPANSVVYVSSVAVDPSFIGRAEQAVFGVPAGSVVQIVAGPSGEIATGKNGYVHVNGHPTNYKAKVSKQALVRQYLAVCIAGACEAQQPVLIGQASIVGEVRGYIGLNGMSDPDGVR